MSGILREKNEVTEQQDMIQQLYGAFFLEGGIMGTIDFLHFCVSYL